MKSIPDIELINGTFELIEEETIDIDSIKEAEDLLDNVVPYM